jgi:hypothetical protein
MLDGKTRGLCDSPFIIEIVAEILLKGQVKIANRPLCGPPRLCELCVFHYPKPDQGRAVYAQLGRVLTRNRVEQV